jgi:cysteine desulfurase
VIYLDYAAHTPPSNAALKVFLDTMHNCTANANAKHFAGKKAALELEKATASIAASVKCNASEIAFVSSASEGNFRAITGVAHAKRHLGRHILSTVYAHPSESAALAALVQSGWEVEQIRLLPDGKLDLAYLSEIMRSDTVLVCVSVVDSELGVVQDLAQIEQILRRNAGCHLHIDAAQAAGKIHLRLNGFACPLTATFSARKFHGMDGIGVLVRSKGVILDGFCEGMTPSPAAAAACAVALTEAVQNLDKHNAYVGKLCTQVKQTLRKHPRVRINSPDGHSPFILNISVEGVRGTQMRDALSARGVCVGVKAACADESSPSRPVTALSGKKNALCAWRISFSHLTTETEIKDFLQIFDEVCSDFFPGN